MVYRLQRYLFGLPKHYLDMIYLKAMWNVKAHAPLQVDLQRPRREDVEFENYIAMHCMTDTNQAFYLG